MIPQPITVQGRSGTVVYMDNNWIPVPAARATMAKVVFDDGGVAFYTSPEPSKPEGIGGITRKFDAASHPRGKDGRFIEASEPRIFNKPSDVKQYDSWGGEKLWGWVDPATGETTGHLLTGVPIPPEDMRATLFHVTTNAPAVEESGVLLGQVGDAGLGGGQAPGVSFTTSREDAIVIQRELKRAVQIARGDLTTEAFTQWAREDEKSAGLPEGSLDYAIDQAMQGWDGNKFILDKKYVQGQGYTDTPPEPEERERIRRSLMKDALNSYLWARETASEKATGRPVPSLKNPILFGRQEHMAKVLPENIQILEVGSNMIPEGALVTTGSDKFLHEVRAYSDVPLWKKLQSVAKKDAAFDESKHPRAPGGTSQGGEFTSSGRGGAAVSDPVLAEQAATGIAAIEKMIPEAVKTADYEEAPAPKTWEDVDSDVQDSVRSAWEEEQYGNLDVDTRDLDNEIRAEVGRDNQAILDKAVEDTIETLNHAKPFKDTDPTLPLTLDLHRTLDPDTIDYGAGDHEEAGWYPSGKKNPGGTVELDLDALRFTSGEELTLEQKNIVKQHWDAAYNEQYLQAVEKVFESDDYSERRSTLESEEVSGQWNNLLDRDKYDFMIERKLLSKSLKAGEPYHWTTGVSEGTRQDEDYARTHAVALRLTEMRTDELRKERDLLAKAPTEKPTFTVVESRNHSESHPSYVAKNAAGEVVAASNTIAQATRNAEDWAEQQMVAENLSTKKIIAEIWDSWKAKSSEGLGLSLQLAAARELGGHHRMTPQEEADAVDAAKHYGGIETLQAYVRAQWEVTQTIMKKAGQDKVDVYRALMLSDEQIKGTPREMLTPKAEPIAPPQNVTVLHRKEPGREKDEYVTFDYLGEHFVVEKEIVMVRPHNYVEPPKDIRDIPDEGFVAEIETTEAAVARRVQAYHESQQGRHSAFVKLPALQLQRAGAQSTTGTVSVANDWQGVGNVPDNAQRVVIRIEAPPTSVLSLPVYGKNIQEEHESVLLGTKDKWLWDAWWNLAPKFSVAPLAQTAKKAEMKRLVIDLQAEDRGKPHWMSSVKWTVQKFDESKHPRDAKGQFAYHGTSNELAQKILAEGLKPLSELDRSSPIGKGFASTSEKVALSYAAMASDDSVDTITVIVFKPEASRYFQPANKHAFGPSGSWAQARSTEMSSTETVPPEMIHEVRQYRLADVVAALGPHDGKQYANWESSLEDVDPVKVVKKQEQVIYVAFLTHSKSVVKWDASKHPRKPAGSSQGGEFAAGGDDFTRVAMTSQRAEGDPGHQTNKVVFQHMREFHKALQALPGVSRVSVKPGVGGWEGGSESMWQVYYRGNGAARKLVARTAKQFNQDAVLILKKCGGQDCQPAVELSFEGGVSPKAREVVHKTLVAHGVGGWTWMKRDGKTILRMVSVPQWGGEAAKHQQATAEISKRLRKDGLPNHRRVSKVRVEVMEREGAQNYDQVISGH